MSGHSKWSTIKRKKGATDALRGRLFSKLIKAITVAAKTGGGPNPEANPKLKVAVEAAKTANMPKANIDRALSKAESAGNLEEIAYEGFAPGGVGLVVEVATDNRNRTGQEIKGLLERGGGTLGGRGSTAFSFVPRGQLVIETKGNVEETVLKLIDAGIEEFEEEQDEVVVYVESGQTFSTKQKLEGLGLLVTSAELTQKPVNLVRVEDASVAKKVFALLETLENQDDVQKVFANIDVSDEVAKEIS